MPHRCIVYRWDMVRELIERKRTRKASPRGVDDRVRRPTTGNPVFKTITFFVQMLHPGQKHLPLAHHRESLVAPFEGKGHSVVDGKRYDWKEYDTLVVPGGSWFEHENDSESEPRSCSSRAMSRR